MLVRKMYLILFKIQVNLMINTRKSASVPSFIKWLVQILELNEALKQAISEKYHYCSWVSFSLSIFTILHWKAWMNFNIFPPAGYNYYYSINITALQTKSDTEVNSQCLVVLPVTFFIVLTVYCALWVIVFYKQN